VHVSPDINRYVNVTLEGLGAVPAARTINNKSLDADIALTATDVGAAEPSHEHSAQDITSGILSVEQGGTGASSAETALENLGAVETGIRNEVVVVRF